MTGLHAIVPCGVDDPLQPSGGNRYDRKVLQGLGRLGWDVVEHAVRDRAEVAAAMAAAPDGGPVLVDGLVAASAPRAVTVHADRIRLVVLVHSPFAGLRNVLPVADIVLTTSEWMREQVVGSGIPPHRVHAAEPGAEPALASPATPAGQNLLTVGAVVAAKGQDVLLTALLALSDLPWHAVWVGPMDRDAAFVDRLRRRIDDGGLTGRIELRGPVADQARIYGSADLLVHPTRAEAYGMVVAEALAHGLPVIASHVGGVAEAMGRSSDQRRPGALVPPGDANALAAQLRRWLVDDLVRRRWRTAAAGRRLSLPTWADAVAAVDRALVGIAG